MCILEQTPDPPPRIHAISSVQIEAMPGLEDRLRWFYGELLGLESTAGENGNLVFHSKRLQLVVALKPDARSSPMRRRLVLEIPSLDRMREQLDELQMVYEWYEGMAFTERRIFLLDPGENRIELKQVWVF